MAFSNRAKQQEASAHVGRVDSLDYDVRVIDPGFSVEWERAGTEQAKRLVRQWYGLHISQALVDARQRERRAMLVRLGLRSDRVTVASRPEW